VLLVVVTGLKKDYILDPIRSDPALLNWCGRRDCHSSESPESAALF
jgi:hypothetical protein